MKDTIVDLLKGRKKAMDVFEIAEALEQPVDAAFEALTALTGDGRVALTRKGRYALTTDLGLISARTGVLRKGGLVARPMDGSQQLLIKKRGDLRPMADDLILVRLSDTDPTTCTVEAITRRAREGFLAIFAMMPVEEPLKAPRKNSRKDRGRGVTRTRVTYAPSVTPVDPRLTRKIELEGDLNGARNGDMVMLKIVGWPSQGVKLRAVIERVMGDADDIRVQLSAIAANHGLRDAFPPGALAQADALPQEVLERDREGRLDLTALTLFTIDGIDAQDFDDAVSLEKTEVGYRLGVHIADVSHYVRPGTPIDREALERGTSVYLPGLTLPMLPEPLSNRMCSLMPNVDRLAMSLMMEIANGKVVDHTLSPSVIHSSARLTYEEVNKMLAGEKNDVPEDLHGTLRAMVSLANVLRQARHARGSIDFDLPEAAFTLGPEGRPIDVFARNRGESERMIEDFMLLANETVALLARTTELPFLYRVHAKPDTDRVRSLEAFLGGLDIKTRLGADPSPMRFSQVLEQAEGKPEESLIKQVMLRSLRRAEYAAEPLGHFGLAANDYCHFTSPIRRYPDLMVHRMLKLLLSGSTKEYAAHEKHMPDLARLTSAAEQRATLAERDADDLLKAHYMLGHIGEEFDGIVTGVAAWGFYVTLPNTVEGLVPLRTMEGDWDLDAERHQLKNPRGGFIRLGDAARVSAARVTTFPSEIDFTLIYRHDTKRRR